MREQRSYKRLDLEGGVCLRTGNGKPRIVSAFLDDVSFGGFQIYAQEKIGVDKDVEFEMTSRLLDQPLKGWGIVRHVHASKRYNADFFSMGVEFLETEKKEVVSLIKKILGWKDAFVYHRPIKRELSLLLRFAPLTILITWLVLKTTSGITASMNEEHQYMQKIREGVAYYLYNRQ